MTPVAGQRFGTRTVVAFAGCLPESLGSRHTRAFWATRCDCGSESLVAQKCLSTLRQCRKCSPALCDPFVPRTTPEPAPVPGARWVALTAGKFALVDETDYAGVSIRNWHYDRKYPACHVNGSRIRMHTFLLPGAEVVDHVNLNKLDNRRANLRAATHIENHRNQPLRRGNTSGFKGVALAKRGRKWRAYIGIDRKHVGLGVFGTNVEAACMYNAAALTAFGAFARPNRMD